MVPPSSPIRLPVEQQGETNEEEEEEDDDLVHPLISDSKRASGSEEESKTHRRNISLDEINTPFPSSSQRDAANTPTFMGHRRRVPSNIKISMRQVMDHSPYETEVDAYIQCALEETEEEAVQGVNVARQSILSNVPLDVPLYAFRGVRDSVSPIHGSSPAASAASNATPSLSGAATSPPLLRENKSTTVENLKKPQSKRRMSVSESLYQLTKDLEQFQSSPSHDSATNATTAGHREDDGRRSLTNSLLKNAAIIMNSEIESFRKRRNQGSTAMLEQNDSNTATWLPLSSSIVSKQSQPRVSKEEEDGLEMITTMSMRERGSPKSQISNSNSYSTNPQVASDISEPGGIHVGSANSGSLRSSKIEGNGSLKTSVSHQIDKSVTDSDAEPPRSPKTLFRNPFNTATQRALTEYKDFEDWLRFKRSSVRTHVKVALFFIMLPATAVAAILFYVADNPPCSRDTNECTITPIQRLFGYSSEASASWWLLFICCRQIITFTLARATNSVVVYYLGLHSGFLVRIFGPWATLFIVQSGGWPLILFSWGFYDLILLYGNGDFVRHWLFYQHAIGLFNEENPSGDVLACRTYLICLVLSIAMSFVVAVKRATVGVFLGKQAFTRYGEELARVMSRALMIGQVARLSRDIESLHLRFENFDFKVASYDASDFGERASVESLPAAGESNAGRLLSGFDAVAKKARLNDLLGAWEEPDGKSGTDKTPDIAAVLQFRQSLAFLDAPLPFGPSFGPSSTREECVESAEAVYNRLLQSVPGRDVLIFDVLAMLAISDKGELDEEMLVALIKLFRPDREGFLTVLDFAKSVDSVLKEIRLLRANVANSSKLDRAAETMLNVFFYYLVMMIVIASFGFNPFAVVLAVSGYVVVFSLSLKYACSSFFEGFLLILFRRPYDIGDRIHVGVPTTETSRTGSRGWVVQDITLFTTTYALGATREVATAANGALANTRIINAARSPKASLNFDLKFPINTPYDKLKFFKSVLLQFLKARPREWSNLVSFRCIGVATDLGYVAYLVNARHREPWQQNAAIKQSRADLSMFLHELTKKMGMRYVSPPMPIELMVKQRDVRTVDADDSVHRSGDIPRQVSYDDIAHDVAFMFDTELPR